MSKIHAEVLKINLRTAQEAARFENFPDNSTPPWLKEAVKEIREGKTLSVEDIQAIQSWGGTTTPHYFSTQNDVELDK